MSEMIERVAKAIQAKCKERGYNECPAPLVHHVAGAAIEAMREPTDAMTDAAFDNSLGAPGPMDPDFPPINTRIYRAMIDAALSCAQREEQP